MSIEERLARLERGNRFWKRLAFVLLVLVFAFVASESVKLVRPAGLEARSLAILDTEGQVRMKVGCDSDGEIKQKFFDATGNLRLDLGEGLGGTYLGLGDTAKKVSLVALAAEGEVTLGLLDNQNAIRLLLQVSREGSPLFWMCDAKGNVIWQAPR